jgi:hypothetical protein
MRDVLPTCLVVLVAAIMTVMTVGGERANCDPMICGDANGGGFIENGDPIFLINYIFSGGPPPSPVSDGNTDASCRINVADAIVISNYLFGFGGPPVCADTSACVFTRTGGDSVIIGNPPYTQYPGGDSVAVPVYMTNSAALAGLSVGLHYASSDIEITSINTSGSVAGSVMSDFDAVQNAVLLGYYSGNPFASIAPQSGGLLVTLNVRILAGDPGQNIELDTLFFPPGGENIFVRTDASLYGFEFAKPEAQQPYETPVVDTSDVYFARVADMDRDNYADLVYCGASDTGLFIKYGDPVDTLSEAVSYADISQAAIDIDYLNNDTLLDIIAVTATKLYVLLNQGHRVFDVDSVDIGPSSRQRLSVRQEPHAGEIPSIAVGFLDGDIYKDVIYAPNTVLYGVGDGTFSGSTSLPFDFNSVYVGDFNYDGYEDLLTSGLDSVKIYLNAGSGSFNQTASMFIDTVALDLPPAAVLADLNEDNNLDFAIAVPLVDPPDQSVLLTVSGDGAGSFSQSSTIAVSGKAYDVVVTDANRDNHLDLILGNGTNQQIEIRLGDGAGSFDDPTYIDLDAGADLTYVVATLDLNRDGNPDFLAGGPDGDNLFAAIDIQSGTTESLDELYVIGYDGVAIEVTDPLGFVVSENFQTVASSAYWRHDINYNDSLDDQLFDYNLMFGEYSIRLYPGPGVSQDVICCAGIGINGSRYCTFFDNYAFTPTPRTMNPGAVDTITFYYEVEATPSIFPDNGVPTGNEQPRFNWEGKVDDLPSGWSYHFQLSPYYDFRTTQFDVTGLDSASYRPDDLLGIDSVYYWRFLTSDGAVDTDTSRTFAAYIVSSCCAGMSGNVDGDSEELIDIGDLTALIRYLYIPPNPEPPCMPEANVDGDAGRLVDIGDLTALISYLYIPPNPVPAECW